MYPREPKASERAAKDANEGSTVLRPKFYRGEARDDASTKVWARDDAPTKFTDEAHTSECPTVLETTFRSSQNENFWWRRVVIGS
jgi:hypothetical protein